MRPSDDPSCKASLGAIYQWFNELLGRPPRNDDDANGWGRVGQPCQLVYDDIYASQEAQNFRNNKAACESGGHTWVLDGQGGHCDYSVGPIGPIGPPPAPPGGAPPNTGIPGLDAFLRWLQDVAAAKDEILRKLKEQVDSIKQVVDPALGIIQHTVGDAVSKFFTPVTDAFKNFQGLLAGVVQGLVPTTLALVGAALGGVETIAASFLNNAASIEDITAHLSEFLGGKKLDIGGFLMGAIGGAVESGLMGAIDAFTRDHPQATTLTLDHALTNPGLSPRVRELLTIAKDREHSPAALVTIGVLVSTAIGIMGAISEPEIENARQWANDMSPNTTMEYAQAVDAYARGFIDEPTSRQLTKLKGLRPQLWGLMTRMATRQPEIDAVYAGQFRGTISDKDKRDQMHKLGFDDFGIALLDTVMQNIPNVSDVLRFLVRDVFIPEFVEAFGMDKEYPPDADVWAKKLGIPHDVMMLHWRAHWELPSISQAFEMFQRNKLGTANDPTGEIALRRLLRAQGVEPFWRDPIIAIAYNPLTRVDLRRMDKIGTITNEQLLRGYLDIGYSPEQAKLLYDFTKAYNKADKPKALTDLTDSLKGRVITAVMNATIKEAEGVSMLKAIGYADAEIQAFITEARLFRQEKISEKVATLVGDLFIKGHRTEAEVRTALSEHGYITAEIDQMVRELKLEKELKEPSAKVQAEKDLSATNVITSFTEGGMSEADARKYLLYLRYDPTEADVLISSAKFKRGVQEEKDAIEVVHVGVLTGRMSEGEASGELSSINLPSKKRDALLAKWSLERHGKVEKIPLSSLKDLLARNLWDDTKMTAYLRETGYSADDISALLILWGSQAEERKAKAAAAAAKKGKGP